MNISIDLVKQLRELTSASVADCKNALSEAKGDIEKAKEIMREKGIESASKKGSRATEQGLVESYVHQNGRIGVLVELLCETDFVARTMEFKHLAHEIAMQVASMNPKDTDTLKNQEYIRDGSKKIEDLIKETIAKLGENIVIKRFERFEVGE